MAHEAKYQAMAAGMVALVLSGAWACVLADPPAALPIAPFTPIRILRDSVTPQGLLTSLPGEFVVPVAADPRESELQYQFFVDQTAAGALRRQGIGTDGGALVTVPDPLSIVVEECHTLELRVSYLDFTGADSISWFYSPTGNFNDCPVYDAGPPDAGDAATEGGGGGG